MFTSWDKASLRRRYLSTGYFAAESSPLVLRMYSSECSLPRISPRYVMSSCGSGRRAEERVRARRREDGERRKHKGAGSRCQICVVVVVAALVHTSFVKFFPSLMYKYFFRCLIVTFADVRMYGFSTFWRDASLSL